MFGWFKRRRNSRKRKPQPKTPLANGVEVTQRGEVSAGAVTPMGPSYGDWAGDKYYGGWGETWLYSMDYWTLRTRSGQLFRDNLYARGIIRRFVTSEINTGLTLECIPDESILGFDEGELNDWAESVENYFQLWANDPKTCDYEGRRTFGEMQREVRRESLIEGDILVVLHVSPETQFPKIQLISGSRVQNPSIINDRNVSHGVERDGFGKHIAYYVRQDDGTVKRIPAYGAGSGRRVSWLVYGVDRRMDDVRGEPMLAIIMQSLKEIDRYRDSAQRKATINSIIAAFIEKQEPGIGTLPMQGGAVRAGSVEQSSDNSTPRKFGIADHIPGMVLEELQVGEKPTPYSTQGTDVNFGPFEDAITQAMAWCSETPPEILRQSYGSNYSASQAANNDHKMYISMRQKMHGDEFDHLVYFEWFISAVLTRRIQADGFLQAYRDPSRWDITNAWTASAWSGAVKPAVDIVKQGNGYDKFVSNGWSTNTRAARELTGTKFSKNIKRLIRENELKVQAARVLSDFENEVGQETAARLMKVVDNG